MSILDDIIAGAVKVEVAKAENPRLVQTVEQRQVATGQNVNAQVTPNAGGSVASSGSMFAGFDKRILMGTGALILGLIVIKVLK